ncbi:MAG: hypothetical protein AAF745_17930, partial [Planctomycetota bacterium]
MPQHVCSIPYTTVQATVALLKSRLPSRLQRCLKVVGLLCVFVSSSASSGYSGDRPNFLSLAIYAQNDWIGTIGGH